MMPLLSQFIGRNITTHRWPHQIQTDIDFPFQEQFHRSYTSGGVRCIRYITRNLDNFCMCEPLSFLLALSACLKVCVNLFASPSLLRSWLGGMEHFSNSGCHSWPYILQTLSMLIKGYCQRPIALVSANNDLKTSRAPSAVVVSMSTTSNLGWLSTITKKIEPIKAPAKSCAPSPTALMARGQWW